MAERLCPSCGAPVDAKAAFCSACGSNTAAEPAAAAAESAAAAETATVVQPSTLTPDRIGPYKILQLLGEGGMGEVYLAEQTEPVRRRVALKIIKLGMDTKEIVARFASERQALAVMDHPHIARVYDAGVSDEGRPYFVMELVTGVPLTEYCDTHKLPTQNRLRLFIRVCEAILHAHQKGIVHRDLKPSNILITVQEEKPIPKIIDFGIAKAMGQSLTENTFVTAIGLPIGTPAYMSPEQAEMSGLDVDTRADIYTLGVILYELLSGTLPFDQSNLAADYAAFQKRMRETDPPVPSARMSILGEKLPTVAELRQTSPASLKRELEGDLDWIIMKAMEKDRTRRYETVNALIKDVERYLNFEPVSARAPTIGYRAGKFVRRYRGWVAAAALAVTGLGVGLGTATYEWRRAEAARARALQNLNLAIEAVDEMLVAAGDTLAFANAPALEEIREELFAKARRFYEQFEEQTTEPEYRLATAMASQRIADVQARMGEGAAAEAALGEAIAQLAALTDDFPDRSRYQHHLAESYNLLGLQLAPRDPVRAKAAYDTALALQDDLIARVPEEAEYMQYRARTLYNRGILLASDSTTLEDAEEDYRTAIEALEALIRADDGGREYAEAYRQELARSFNNLANVLRNTGREIEAWRYYERALGLLEDLSSSSESRAYKQELAIYANNLALLLSDGGDSDLAADRSRQALALFEELAAPLASLDIERANSYATLGLILLDLGLPDQAEDAYNSSLEIWERLEASSDRLARDPVFQYRFGFTLFDLALMRIDSGDTAGGGRMLVEAADHHEVALRSIDTDTRMMDICYAYSDLSETPSAPTGGAAARAVALILEVCDF
jgi:eukaryotic-like serine/threonine-protein kinase